MGRLKALSPPQKWALCIFGLGVILQLLLLPVPRADQHLLSSDGAYYFAYLRSFMLDFDLNLANEIALYNAPISDPAHQMRLSHITYAYAIGSALLWLPFFLLAQILIILLNILGGAFPTHGYTFIHEFAVTVGSLVYGCLGFYCSAELIKKYFPQSAAWAFWGYLGGSSVIYYFVFEPTMSHLNSLGVCALFLWAIELKDTQAMSSRRALTLGLLTGTMFLVRWQNLVFALALLRLWPEFSELTKKQGLQRLVLFGLGSGVLCSLQFLFWKATHGRYFLIPQGAGFVDWWHPRFWDILFTTQHGLVSWTPISGLALLGACIWAVRTRQHMAWWTVLFLGLNIYINAAVVGDIGGGAAFGMRRFINCFPLLGLGLAAMFSWQGFRPAWKALTVGALLCWNGLFMVQYRLGFIDPIAPLSWHEMTLGKFEMLTQIKDKVQQKLQ